MPVFKVIQKVSHARIPRIVEKVCHISGHDLGHAITAINIPLEFDPETRKRELAKKYHTEFTRHDGRTISIEIIEELE